MIATVPLGAIQEMTVSTNAFSSEFGWTAGPAVEHRHQVRHEQAARRSALHEPSRRHAGEDVFDQELLPAVGVQLRHADARSRRSARWTFPMR